MNECHAQNEVFGGLPIAHRRMLDSALLKERSRATPEVHVSGEKGASAGAAAGEGAAPVARATASTAAATAVVDGSGEAGPKPYLSYYHTCEAWLGTEQRKGRVQLSKKHGKQLFVLKLEDNEAAAAFQYKVMQAVSTADKLHVVTMNGFFAAGPHDARACFELEHLGDDLVGYIMRNGHIDPYLVKLFAHHLVEAVAYIHAVKTGDFSDGVVHMDIKPLNVLLDSRPRVRLVDFDSSRGAGQDVRFPMPPGVTECYTSPEVFKAYKNKFSEPFVADKAHDMFCVGLVLWVLFDSDHKPAFMNDDDAARAFLGTSDPVVDVSNLHCGELCVLVSVFTCWCMRSNLLDLF